MRMVKWMNELYLKKRCNLRKMSVKKTMYCKNRLKTLWFIMMEELVKYVFWVYCSAAVGVHGCRNL